MLTALQNRKKPILAAVGYALAYLFCTIVLNMDAAQAHTAAAGAALVIAERVGPIFGINIDAPQLARNGQVLVRSEVPVRDVAKRRKRSR